MALDYTGMAARKTASEAPQERAQLATGWGTARLTRHGYADLAPTSRRLSRGHLAVAVTLTLRLYPTEAHCPK